MPTPRIVSLLPSATEMLCAIGGAELLVGRSHECDYPASLAHLPVLTAQRIGGTMVAGAAAAGASAHAAGGPHAAPTGAPHPPLSSAEIDASVRTALGAGQSLYTLDEPLLRKLKPDLILTQDLCEVCSIDLRTVQRVAATMTPRPRVMNFNPTTIWQVLDDMLAIGEALDDASAASAAGTAAAPTYAITALRAVTALRDRWWTAHEAVTPYVTGPSVLFLEWTDPPFVGGHWTPELVEAAGGRHPLNPPGAHSRVASAEEIIASAPERVVICPCGFDLPRTRIAAREAAAQPWWDQLPAVRGGRPGTVMLVDGNQMFNRPGPRLVDAFEWLVAWLADRPELAPPGFPAEGFRSDDR